MTLHGRFPEELTEVKAEIALDPLSVGANMQLASVLMMARRYDDSIQQYETALQMDPGFTGAYRGIALLYAYKRDYGRALAAAEKAKRAAGTAAEDQEYKACLGYVLAAAGRSEEALAIVRELVERYDRAGEAVAVSIAAIHAGLGQRDASLGWRGRASDARDSEIGYLKVDPRWDNLRGDRRFTALLTNLGFH